MFLAPNYMCHSSICICDVSIYMFKYFVSLGLIPNFMLFVFRRPKKPTKKHKHTQSAMMFLAFVLMLIFI